MLGLLAGFEVEVRPNYELVQTEVARCNLTGSEFIGGQLVRI